MDTDSVRDIPYLDFGAWLDRECTEHRVTEHALARAYAGPDTLPDSLPKKQMRGYRRGGKKPAYSSAYRIGSALHALGVRDVTGPVALYAAGHYDRLVAFFAALSKSPAIDPKVGTGSQQVVKLYCTLWASNFNRKAIEQTTLDSDSKRELLHYADYAAEHLTIYDGYSTADYFDKAWVRTTAAAGFADAISEQLVLERAEIIARAERDAGSPPRATWPFIEKWIEALAPQDFEHYRAHLGTYARIDAAVRYPHVPLLPLRGVPSTMLSDALPKKGRAN